MPLPVVLIHNGNSGYLYDTLYQLRQSNPGIVIYLIGTTESKVYKPLVTHIMVDDYTKESEVFNSLYQHFSTNTFEFELICLQRWFILKGFMEAMKIEQCLYIDSDVLIYSDIPGLAHRMGEFGMTITGISGHTNFVRYNTLTDFCNFLLEAYKDNAATEKLKQEYEIFLLNNPAGGISDMTFLYQFSKLNPDRVLNLRNFGSSEAFDITVDTGSGEYEMSDSVKAIIWKDNKPYCRRLSDNQLVLYHTLHFQGKTKEKIASFIKDKSIRYRINRRLYSTILIFQKLKRKLVGA